MAQTVIIDAVELKSVIKSAFNEWKEETDNTNKKAIENDRLYTINEVRKRLGKAHATIKKLVANGLIKTTKDGLISEAAINEYLQKS